MQNGKCVSKANFGFIIIVGVDPSVFYQNYIQFLQGISNIVGQNYGTVSLILIRLGSTQVSGIISTDAQ